MNSSRTYRHSAWIFCVVLGSATFSAHCVNAQSHERARIVLDRALPPLEGARLKATVVEVHYGPGESSPQHTHPCPVIGYVTQGAYRSQIGGESEHIYKTGDTFYEAPNTHHILSANASKTEPAAFVAFFLCDRDTPLSKDIPTRR
jgi:quercetin dioxygenase-like cupin family protein